MNLLREQLFNSDAEFRRQQAIREAQEKEGHKLVPPDSVFYEIHFQKRGDIIREYSAANQEMQKLRQSCLEEGLVVEEPRLPPFDEQNALDKSRRYQKTIAQLTNFSADGRSDITASFLSRDIDTRARIAGWLIDVRNGVRMASLDATMLHSKRPQTSLDPKMGPPSNQGTRITFFKAGKPSIPPDYSSLQTVREARTESETETEHLFQPDPPRDRRYSEPSLPTIFVRHRTGGLINPRENRSELQDQTSKSVS